MAQLQNICLGVRLAPCGLPEPFMLPRGWLKSEHMGLAKPQQGVWILFKVQKETIEWF